MSIDSDTKRYLDYQRRRRAHCLTMTPPDRKEAELCMRRIDSILDRQRRIIAVASDGEAITSDASSWVQAQVLASDQVAELTSQSSQTLPCEVCGTALVPVPGQPDMFYCQTCSGANPAPGGGTAVLERPQRHPISEADIAMFRKELGLDPS